MRGISRFFRIRVELVLGESQPLAALNWQHPCFAKRLITDTLPSGGEDEHAKAVRANATEIKLAAVTTL
jgi:hypothetical protein